MTLRFLLFCLFVCLFLFCRDLQINIYFEEAKLARLVGRFEDAVDLCDKVLAARPRDSAVQLEKAANLRSLLKLDEASALLKELLEHDSNNADAHCMLGVLHKQNRRYGLAVASLETALSLNANIDGGKQNLALGESLVRGVGAGARRVRVGRCVETVVATLCVPSTQCLLRVCYVRVFALVRAARCRRCVVCAWLLILETHPCMVLLRLTHTCTHAHAHCTQCTRLSRARTRA